MQVCSTCNMLFICLATPLLLLLFRFALFLVSLSSLHSFPFDPRHCANLYYAVQRTVTMSVFPFVVIFIVLYSNFNHVLFIYCHFMQSRRFSCLTQQLLMAFYLLRLYASTHTLPSFSHPLSLLSVCILFARAALPRCAVSCRMDILFRAMSTTSKSRGVKSGVHVASFVANEFPIFMYTKYLGVYNRTCMFVSSLLNIYTHIHT